MVCSKIGSINGDETVISRFQRLGRPFLALVAISATAAASAAVSVDTNEDGNDGECQLDCTLREAIATAMPGEMVLVP